MRPRIRRRFMAEINVVPYIDVMLVLLIIFMVSTPLLYQGVDVDLPKADAQSLTDLNDEPIVLTVDGEGRYYLNLAANPGEPLSDDQVVANITVLLKKNPQLPVLLKADKTVRYAVVMKAMALMQQAGSEKVSLLVDKPGQE